ncbi:MAG TPA: hypothetical protein VKV27_01520 [Solirubrobacteraceae bacterium]|nr:hypothetical protein [Solirubrobacteraceae bacterium]
MPRCGRCAASPRGGCRRGRRSRSASPSWRRRGSPPRSRRPPSTSSASPAEFIPGAFRHFHVDGTSANTHALLEHCCAAYARREHCRRLDGHKPAKRLTRAWDEEVEADRHKRSSEPEPADDAAPPENRLVKLSDEQAAAAGLDWESFTFFTFGGHLLRCRDKQVGARYYGPRRGARKSKFWVGSYFMPAVSDYFAAPVAFHIFNADIQEHLGFPELDRKVQRTLGRKPESYVFDKAFANTRTYKHNTLQGIATVAPDRDLPGGGHMSRLRCDDFDEHGVVRCQHCGGPTVPDTRTAPFAIQAGDPRLRVRCLLRHTPACETSIRTISCSRAWRVLTPMSRLDARYHDLLRSHKTAESIFDNWRDRYAVAGTSQATRSKRRGHQAAQQLRASAALLAEWFRICLRHRFIGNHARLNLNAVRQRDEGDFAVRQLEAYRREHLLDLPYGPAADALGITATTYQTDINTGAVEHPLRRPGPPGPQPDDPDDRPF